MTLDALRSDLRDSWRSLQRRPLTSLAATVTLALGIGLNAAVFSVFDWVLFRPLPYPGPHQLVRVFTAGTQPVTEPADLTYSEFISFARIRAFRSAAAFSLATRVMSGPAIEPTHVDIARVSGDLFAVLGVAAEIGRPLSVDEVSSGAAVVVVSEQLWRTRFHGDLGIVGRPIAIDSQLHTVVGVMPAGLGYPSDVELWRPLTTAEREDDDRENAMIARLGDGATSEAAALEIATLASGASNGGRTGWAEDMQQTHVRPIAAALTALLASAGLILLMACANVAALVGARSAERASEMAVRGALGASRGRLMRQVLIENGLTAVAGGAVGLVLGRWTLDLLVSIAPDTLPRATEITLDGRIVMIGCVATLIVGVVVGLLPSFRASRVDLRRVLGTSRVFGRPRRVGVLVTAQTAMAVVLVIAAGLLGRSLQHLIAVDHGFSPERLLAIDLYLRGGFGGDVRQLYRELIETAEAVPGVRSASVTLRLPNQVGGLRVSTSVDGIARQPSSVVLRPVTAGYFETAGIQQLAGRAFNAGDRQSAPAVAIVNRAFVRGVLDGDRAVGATIRADVLKTAPTIVGVVSDVTPAGESDRPALYVPLDQVVFAGGSLLVRTTDAPQVVLPSLTSRLRTVAPTLALDRIHVVADSLAAGRAVVRFNTRLAATFAMLALLLAAIAVYGLTAGELGARWREVALRLALGAPMHLALWSVMRTAAGALAVGVLFGIAVTLVIGRWMVALLRGVTPADPSTLVAAPLVIVGVAMLAAALAARRVRHLDPATALRSG